MGRERIRDVKKPYAATNIYNPGLNPPVVPDYTNPLQIGKLLQLQQWPNCPQQGGPCHPPHIISRPDIMVVLNEHQFQAPAQVAVQVQPGPPGGPSTQQVGPLPSAPPTAVAGPSGQGSIQPGNDNDDDDIDEEEEDEDDPYDQYGQMYGDDDGNDEDDDEEGQDSTVFSEDDNDAADEIYDDDNDDDDDDGCDVEEYDDGDDDLNDESNEPQKRKSDSSHNEPKKIKTSESSRPLECD